MLEFSKKLDRFILHPILGIPLFLALIYCVFTITVYGGGQVQSFMSQHLQFLLIEKVASFMHSLQAPEWLVALFSSGLGQGIHTTLCFIPVIASMFFCLTFLETSGYMARAAIVMGKIMSRVGLSGKSFMPMILGFGCNVPAILSARSLENPKEPKDRILTVLMTPFMSCGARLAVYALFVSAFFKENGANIIFALYMVGISMALLTAWILGQTLSRSSVPKSKKKISKANESLKRSAKNAESASAITELALPPYCWPNLPKLIQATIARVKSFVWNAGMMIIPLCMLIGTLGAIKTEGQDSYLTRFGRHITPVLSPMGIEEDNWQATVGLLSGLIAKEVMVGTLTALYAEPIQNAEPTGNSASSITSSASPSPPTSTQNSLGVMVERFGSQKAAFAYLLFVLLYFPCISVLATISRELSFSWAIFSSIWTTGIAYSLSVLFYQVATIAEHPGHSCSLIGMVLLALGLGFKLMKTWAGQVFRKQQKNKFPTQIVILNS